MVSSTTRRVNRVAGAFRPEEGDAGPGGWGLLVAGVSPLSLGLQTGLIYSRNGTEVSQLGAEVTHRSPAFCSFLSVLVSLASPLPPQCR